jgi:hypothetical protein
MIALNTNRMTAANDKLREVQSLGVGGVSGFLDRVKLIGIHEVILQRRRLNFMGWSWRGFRFFGENIFYSVDQNNLRKAMID